MWLVMWSVSRALETQTWALRSFRITDRFEGCEALCSVRVANVVKKLFVILDSSCLFGMARFRQKVCLSQHQVSEYFPQLVLYLEVATEKAWHIAHTAVPSAGRLSAEAAGGRARQWRAVWPTRQHLSHCWGRCIDAQKSSTKSFLWSNMKVESRTMQKVFIGLLGFGLDNHESSLRGGVRRALKS